MMMMVMVVGVWCVVCSGTWGFSGVLVGVRGSGMYCSIINAEGIQKTPDNDTVAEWLRRSTRNRLE